MTTRSLLLRGALSIALALSLHQAAAFSQITTGSQVIGDWRGTLVAGDTKLTVVFHVAKSDSGQLAGTLDSPDQGAMGIPVSSVEVSTDSVVLFIPSIGGKYAGRISPDGSSIAGNWSQMGGSLPLKLERTSEKIVLKRPQEPKPPYLYRSEDVAYENSVAGIKLAGTLTMPDSGGPFPAVILITGSGPEDRNEEVFGHKPFLVIADYLTRRGIAVLRVDDRGVGGSSGGKWSEYTTADYATDVMAGINFLKSRKDIDPAMIGLAGHSEGGIIAPMVAAKSADVAFVVMLAGTGYDGSKIVLDQTRLGEQADGAAPEKVQQDVQRLGTEFSIIKSGKDSSSIADELRRFLSSTFSDWGSDLKKSGVDSSKVIEGQISAFDSPWFRFFLSYDPLPALRQLKCPVLAMGGTLDLQVPAEENLKAIGNALKEGGNRDYSIKLLPQLNHMFQHAGNGSEKEYAQIEETFSPEALQLMGDWIVDLTRSK